MALIHFLDCAAGFNIDNNVQDNCCCKKKSHVGRISLKSRRAVIVIIYWLKSVQLDNTKFVKNIYSLMYRNLDNNPTHMSWASNVKTLLQSIGLYEACVNQGVGNVNVLSVWYNRECLICLPICQYCYFILVYWID